MSIFSFVGDFFKKVEDVTFGSDKVRSFLKKAATLKGGGGDLIGSMFKHGDPSVGDDVLGGYSKFKSPAMKGQEEDLKNRAIASASAAESQAEYEEQAAAGAERTKAKRRRGFQSTILTDGPTETGSATSGKTLLGE